MRVATLILLASACAGAPTPEPQPAPSTAPAPEAPSAATGDTLTTSAGAVGIEPLYHGTLALDVAGRTWIVDPWSKAPLDDREADVILLTDIHPDHLDPAAIAKVTKEGTVVVGPAAVAEQTHVDVTIANGETKEVDGVQVTGVPMYNLTRGPEEGKVFHEKGRGNGYVLQIGDKRIYIAGDTECTDEMKALKDIDVAFVPMNLPYTMTPEEAVACLQAFRPAVVYPYHYNTSDLSGLAAALEGSGVEVRLRDWYPGGQPF